jgi:hypothetical protein
MAVNHRQAIARVLRLGYRLEIVGRHNARILAVFVPGGSTQAQGYLVHIISAEGKRVLAVESPEEAVDAIIRHCDKATIAKLVSQLDGDDSTGGRLLPALALLASQVVDYSALEWLTVT